MKIPRFAGDELFAQSQQMAAQMETKNQRNLAVIERQRQRDIAAAKGKFIGFNQNDIIT